MTVDIEKIPLDVDETNDSMLDELLDYSDIEAANAIPNGVSMDNMLVIDNLPIVDENKKSKLISVLCKKFAKEAMLVSEDTIFMPMDPKTGNSKGYMFVEMPTAQEADAAIKTLHMYKFDASHTLFVNHFDDIEKYVIVDEDWNEEVAVGVEKAYEEKEFLRDWLLDSRARDQLCVFRDDEVTLFWNNKKDPHEVVLSRQRWAEGYIAWSPKGSYLATAHKQGIALWGGKSMGRIVRFQHAGVRYLDFSPGENYLITLSAEPFGVPPPDKSWGPETTGHSIAIWDIATGRMLRSFPLGTPPKQATGPRQIQWPIFKWTSDDRYFARLFVGEKISVYEAPSMVMLDKKSIPIEGVTEFEWQPFMLTADSEIKGKDVGTTEKKPQEKKSNIGLSYILAYFTPQLTNDRPAQLALMSIPEKKILRQKQVFFGIGCKIHFQSNGDYLLFKVDRTNRTRKAQFTSLEVFRLRERDYPSDVVEVKEIIVAFAWEPIGNRFALITNTEPLVVGIDPKTILGGTTGKMNVHFYIVESMVERKGQTITPGGLKLMKLLERRSVNSLFWSPKGRFVILAGLRNLTEGTLEFWDLSATDTSQLPHATGKIVTSKTSTGVIVTTKKDIEPVQCMNTADHCMATDVAWDATGRYAITTVTMWGPKQQMDTGYHLWEFNGHLLQKVALDHLKQVLWRPRSPTLLTEQDIKQVRKTLKEHSREFEEEDAIASSALSKAELDERKRLFDEWYAWRKSMSKMIEQQLERKKEIRGELNTGRPDEDIIEEIFEEVIDEREEVVE